MTEEKAYKTIKWEDRLRIETLLRAGHKPQEIADLLGFHHSSIYRELKRGKTIKRNSDWTESEIYSPDLAQAKANENKGRKGRPLKVGCDYKFVKYVEKTVGDEKNSPAVALAEIKRKGLKFDTKICLTTLYNYIKGGVFLNLTMMDCPYRVAKKKGKKKRRVQKRLSVGTSIEERPVEILKREELGNWEMDTVVGGQGKSKKSFLVLTERKTRVEIIEMLNEHTMAEVVRILDKLERKFTERGFREMFKTITVDNGSEFSDWQGMERSRRNKKKRTKVYYCHPYCSSERGSNENNNKLVRRFYPKGGSFDSVPQHEIKKLEHWINQYPRKLFGWRSAEEVFQDEQRRVAM
ncbi:MAG: IS30 family transposase [Roseburia sp.]|nr:IS30 family transposase [Roseburia sp.]